ncbi:MAG: amino acid adenylation domain-containing protein [Rhodospirillaceae bacterium]
MDKADALLSELLAQDIRLWLADGKLRFNAPPGVLTEALRQRIAEARSALIEHLSRPRAAPLSFGQERMWFLNRLEMAGFKANPETAATGNYTEHLAFAFEGRLDREALHQALALIAERHGVFRTDFIDGETGPEQRINPNEPFKLAETDLSDLAEPGRQAALTAVLDQAAHRLIDLSCHLHISVRLIRSGPERHVLSVSAHHAAWDGWSNGVFSAELSTAYNALVRGERPVLPDLALDFAAIATRQRQQPAEGVLEPALARLAQRLTGWPALLPLPLDRPRPAIEDGQGGALEVRVPADVAGALAEAGRRQGATPFMVLLAGWAVLLSRLSGQRQMLIGTPLAMRDQPGHDALIGYFANTAVIPIDLEGAVSFGALVGRVQAAVLDTIAGREVPFELLVERLAPPRSRSYAPLVQVLFALQPRPVTPPALEGLVATVIPHHNTAARCDLLLNLETTADGGLEGPLTYAASLFDRATVIGWAEHLLRFLSEAPARWAEPLDLTPLAPPPVLVAAAPAVSAAPLPEREPPATPTERRLAALWAELLKTSQIGRHDDFFMLGGHSLLLMRLVNRIGAEGLGRLDLAQAMGATTLSEMAALLDPPAPVAPSVKDEDDTLASVNEESVWMAHRDEPDLITYAVPFAVALPSRSEPATVQTALDRLAARHPALRTCFRERDGTVFRCVLAPASVRLTLSPAPAESEAMAAAMRAEIARPMKLEHGPLFRFTLFRAERTDPGAGDILFMVANHSVIDGWSLDILRTELLELIAALTAGREPTLTALPTTPAEIGTRLRKTMEGPRGETVRAFWRQRLPDLIALGDLPVDDVQPPGSAIRGARSIQSLAPATVEALATLARAGRTTLTVTWVAAVGALLARMKSDGRPVAVALPFAGRLEAEHEGVVGFLTNLLPVRLETPLDRPFSRHLSATAAEVAAVMAHQDYPLRWLIDDALRARGNEPGEIFDTVVVVEDREDGYERWLDPEQGAGKYNLSFVLTRLSSGRTLFAIEHDVARWRPERVRAMIGQLETLILAAATAPETVLADLPLLPEDQRRRLITEFNRTERSYPRDASLATLWQEAAVRHAERPALVSADGVALSYAELDRAAEEMAAGLNRAATDSPGGTVYRGTVGLAVRRGPDAIIATLAILKAGAAYLPLDDKLPPAMVTRLLADCGCRLIIADAAARTRLTGLTGITVPTLEELTARGRSGPLSPMERLTAGAPITGGDPAYIMFTSGSTGEPKGVVIPHRGVARLALDTSLIDLAPGDAMTQGAPLGFDAATLEIWLPLLAGARLEFLSDEEMIEPALLGNRLARSGITALWLTTALFNRVADENPAAFRPLRIAATGGDVLSPPHIARVLSACPRLRLVNGYGPTENSCLTTAHTISAADAVGAIPIGKPITNTRIYVLDERLRPVPAGVWGELCTGGDGLALGYAGRPDLTARAFVTLPHAPEYPVGERVYRTGDLARWRIDGVLEFGGRRDGQVKIRGHRIETGAIEAVLATCPGVLDAGVLAVGTGADKSLLAFVTCTVADESRWRRHLALHLPVYMIPAEFVVLASLPVNANGKKDRRALARLATDRAALAIAAEPVPEAGRAPATEAERLVARVFAELFNRKSVDADDDFFHLGGHSLLAMRLASRIGEATGRQPPTMRALFTARTVTAIAALIVAPEETGGPPPVEIVSEPVNQTQAEVEEDHPLSHGQERLWVMQRLHPDSAAYNVPVAFDLLGALDVDAFGRALVALEQRHHALRLRIVPAADPRDGARQKLAPAGALKPELIDLRAAADPEATARERMSAEGLRPFRLEREAPVRALLFRLAPKHWRLQLVMHHLMCDGWTLGILLRDLSRLYPSVPTTALPPPARQYPDYARWQRAFLAGAEGKALIARQVARLSPLPEPLALPTDRRRPPQRSFRGADYAFTFDEATGRGIERLAEGTTPFMVLVALVHTLLHRHTGQCDFALGTLVAGRDRPEFEEVAGFFVNTLVLRQRIDPDAAFRAHLRAVREMCLEAMADQHCPFETLVEALGVPRDPSRNPLFDVLVVWQDDAEPPPALAGLKTVPVPFAYPFAKFDLSFHFSRRGSRIGLEIEYAADLFDSATIAAFTRRLEVLTRAALAAPDSALSALDFLPPEERTRVVETFNATARDLPIHRAIPELFLDQLRRTPDAPALLDADGAVLDYAGFAARAGAVAAALIAAGVRPGDRVALALRRSPEMMAAIHGILMTGAAYTPLDPDQAPARLIGMLEDLALPNGAKPVVLAPAELRPLLSGAAGLILEPPSASSPNAAGASPLCRAESSDPAYILFTSGSTGRPKGAAIEHNAVLNRILWMQETFPIGPGDVILQKTPVTFDVSVWELFWWSWTGAAVALPPLGTERDPTALVEAVARYRVTVMHFVPSMLAVFLTCLEEGWADAGKLASLRLVFVSGEALDPALADRFDRLLHRRHGTKLHNLYGPTEATVDVSWQPCSPWTGAETVPIGAPIANTQLYVLDPVGRPLPVGVIGEINIGGVQVARGYVNRPDLTAEKFIPDPFRAAGRFSTGRLYRTGDLGRWRRDGVIEYLGRTDHQIKIRGQRIEPGEIEHALEALAEVERAVVVPVSNQGLAELHAYILPAAGRHPTANALRAHARSHLTEAMIPARFFRLDSLPQTSSGKIDRKALTGPPLERGTPTATAPIPAPIAPAVSIAPAAPVGTAEPGIEERITALWQELLPGAEFGSEDGFFDAGGNSLLLIRLHELIEACWPGACSIAELFAISTIAGQAARIRAFRGISPPVPVPFPAPVPFPVTPVPPPASRRTGAVAIIGMAVRLAGADSLDEFWHDVAAGNDRVHPLPTERAAEARAVLTTLGLPVPEGFREAAYLEDIFSFDPGRFRMAPADAALLDPEQRLFLETALSALENAGYGGRALDGAKVGVFAGACPNPSWRDAAIRLAPDRAEQVFTLNVPSNLATRLSFLHDWRGPALMIDTACSSSLAAVHLACRALAAGDCALALAGGAKLVLLPPAAGLRFAIDSSTGRTRAFSEGADGTGMGEGSVVFLLKPLERAEADGDPIHGVILGSALNQDGASSGMAAPNPAAQAEVIQAALRCAGVELSGLSYIEAHGTGTHLGDPIEIEGLTRAAAGTAEHGFALLGSAKGNYGHLDAAAGALGLARAVLALAKDRAPPQPFFTAPNPRIDFARAPVRVADSLTPLPDRGGPRRAGISSFGLSGINVHAVIEAAPARRPGPETKMNPGGWWLVGLSAPAGVALNLYAAAVVEALRAHPERVLADIVRTLTEGRNHLENRLAVWVRDRGDLMARLAVFAIAPEAVKELVETGSTAGGRRGSVSTARGPMVSVVADTEAAARAAARAFVEGATPVWPETLSACRVHLPTAPLARKRCRPDWSATPPTTLPITRTALPITRTALLGPAVATPLGTSRALDVHDPGFWPVAEHRLGGRPTLVGMALLPLLAEAALGNGLKQPLAILALRWLRALQPEMLEPGSIALSVEAPNDKIGGRRATLGGRSRDGRWLTFAEATLAPAVAPSPLDPAALLRHCGAPEEPTAPFSGDHGQVTVSRRWDCLKAVAFTTDGREILARLHRPEAESGDGLRFSLHPGLLDSAAGLVLDRPGLVPAGCAEIVITGPLPARVLVHARRLSLTDNALEAEVTLADAESGAVAVRLTGLRFVTITAGASLEPMPITLMLPVWPSAPLPVVEASSGPLVVVGEGEAAQRICDRLARHGLLAGVTGSVTPDPTVLTLAGRGGAEGLILIPASGEDLPRRTAAILRLILTGLRRPLRLLAVGDGACPETALLTGLVRVAALEEPMLSARTLEIDASTAPESIVTEFAAFDLPEQTARLRNGERQVRRFEPAPAADPDQDAGRSWPRSGVCVITGGSGGLAAALAETASAGGAVTLALLSRHGPPRGDDPDSRQRQLILAELEQRGVTLRHFACNVADRTALAATLAEIRRTLGPITAVIHNAGVPDSAFLIKQSDDDLAAVLAAKVGGARNLDDLTRDDPIEAFVMAGSLTGLFGAPGHAGYTAANAFLDAFAVWRRHRGRPAVTIDWCGLDEIGMAARNVALRPGERRLTPAEAPQMLRRALAGGAAQVALFDRPVADAPVAKTVVDNSAAPAASFAVDTDTLGRTLARIWAEVLGYDRVAPDDDYYALGGDSISGMQIVERIVRELGLPTTLADLFEAGSVAALAVRLAGGTRSGSGSGTGEGSGITPAPKHPTYPLGPEQDSVLAAQQAMGDTIAFNLPNGVTLPPDTDPARLEAALNALVARHDSLRTRLLLEQDRPEMEILPSVPVRLERLTVKHPDQLDALCEHWVRPFDFAAGPAVRFALVSGPAGALALLLDIHHGLADAFSIEVLFAELHALYAGNTELPPPGLQPKDYAWWSKHGEGATAIETARRYWLERYPLPLPALELPGNRARPPRHTWRGANIGFEVEAATVQALRGFARSRRTTPFTVMLATWALLLHRYANSEEVVIAVPVDQRETAGLSRMIGMMVSLLPLRLRVSAEDTVAALIERVQASHTEALRHRACPLGLLLEALAPPAAPDRTPLAEVALSYMNFAEGGGDRGDESGSDFRQFGITRNQCKNDLSIFVRDLPERITVVCEYYSDLFDKAQIERLACHFRTLLAALTTVEPSRLLNSLPLSDAKEVAWLQQAGSSALTLRGPTGLPAPVGIRGELWLRSVATGHRGRWRTDDSDGSAAVLEYGGRLHAALEYGGRLHAAAVSDLPRLSGAIEQALSAHPRLNGAAELSATPGEITVCVVPQPGTAVPTADGLRAWLAEQLPAMAAPTRFVAVSGLPLDAGDGTIDRLRLARDAARAWPLEEDTPVIPSGPPVGADEILVAEIFTELFGEPVTDRTAGFLDLGGHSLLAIRAVNRIAKATGVRLAMADFFTEPSVANLARKIGQGRAARHGTGSAPIIPRAASADTYPASHAQRRLYLAHRFDPTGTAYTMTFAFRCSAALDPTALRCAVRALITRHESLRTAFEEKDGEILQRIADAGIEIPWREDDLRGTNDPRAEAMRLVRREVTTAFDPARPPLLRLRLLRVSDAEWLVLLLVHHIVGDGWSNAILTRELGLLYHDPAAVLPVLPLAYRDYAVWQQGNDWSQAADYWRNMLAGAPETIALPADRPLPEVPSYRGGTVRRLLSAEITAALHALARDSGASMSALGLSVLAALLFRMTRQRDMVLGLSVAGRDHAEVEGLIGFFVNVLPVRVHLEEETEFATLLGAVQTAVMAALDRRDYPFDRLVQDLGQRRGASRRPVVNVVFEYQRFESADGDRDAAPGLPPALEAAGLAQSLYETIHTATAKHDLLLFLIERGEQAELALEYDADIFEAETAERWVGYLAQFAELVARQGNRSS